MIITYLHQHFKTPAESGGTRSFEMARRMVAAGHSVQMICSAPDLQSRQNKVTEEELEGIKIYRISVPYDNAMPPHARIMSFFHFSYAATLLARRLPADVIFATSTPLTIAIPGVFAARRQNAPLVFEVRDLWPELPIAIGMLKFPPARAAARWLERWAYKNSKQVIALSPGMADGVARTGYPLQQIHCIPNSSDIALFDVDPQRGASFRSKRDWLKQRQLIIYAGTLGRINGVGHLVDVARHMLTLDPEIRFLVVGSGAEEGEVRLKAQSAGVLGVNFFMEPALTKSEMPDLFSAATVCTSLFRDIPEMWNNSANKFFDALAAGRPVAINYQGWQAELIERTGAGIVMSAENAKNNAASLHQLLLDAEALKLARHAASNIAKTEFSRDMLADRLIAVLQEAAESSSGSRFMTQSRLEKI